MSCFKNLGRPGLNFFFRKKFIWKKFSDKFMALYYSIPNIFNISFSSILMIRKFQPKRGSATHQQLCYDELEWVGMNLWMQKKKKKSEWSPSCSWEFVESNAIPSRQDFAALARHYGQPLVIRFYANGDDPNVLAQIGSMNFEELYLFFMIQDLNLDSKFQELNLEFTLLKIRQWHWW